MHGLPRSSSSCISPNPSLMAPPSQLNPQTKRLASSPLFQNPPLLPTRSIQGPCHHSRNAPHALSACSSSPFSPLSSYWSGLSPKKTGRNRGGRWRAGPLCPALSTGPYHIALPAASVCPAVVVESIGTPLAWLPWCLERSRTSYYGVA